MKDRAIDPFFMPNTHLIIYSKIKLYLYWAEYQRHRKTITVMALVTYTDEIRMAAPIPEFDIAQDETLQSAMEKIAKAFSEIRKTLDQELFPGPQEITLDSIKFADDFFPGDGLGAVAKQLEGSKLKVEAERQQEDMKITFKASDFGLPEGTAIVSSKVNISGQRHMGRTEIINSDQREMTINIGYNRFPVTLDARVVVATGDGDVELKKKVTINADKSISEETPYEVIDRTSQQKPSDLKGLLKQFETRIKSAESVKKVSG